MSKYLVAAAVLASGACVADQRAGPVGMANPASVYCIQLGGVPETRKDSQGAEAGYCRLPGGRVVDEWALFRGEVPGQPPAHPAPISAPKQQP